MKLVVLGSPGVGKGTYTQELVQKYGLLHISSGDLFRENLKNETELGIRAKSFMDAGQLVPDEVTIGMVKERLSRDDANDNFILDGFPRTIVQAEALGIVTPLDLVINFKADREVIIGRLSGRIICRKSGHIYHLKNIKPQREGICDIDGSELYQRDDDKPEAIEKRLVVYEEQTSPLIDFYKEKGILREITVNEDFGTHKEEIMNRIYKVIEGK
ncbi:adenylate kinase [Candidatus Woesearchaeota archaeon CG10_big_fil_rev_8_21_14_0_10_36_11]|nr:MAG: adenylate kinase [Candidatus Woesearchaeota archaeon CG10_big_fil_rev_8_21_14_0_10_36_11]